MLFRNIEGRFFGLFKSCNVNQSGKVTSDKRVVTDIQTFKYEVSKEQFGAYPLLRDTIFIVR